MQTEAKSLTTALVEVMKAVDYIPKRGVNKTQGYNFAMDADISNKVRQAMGANGVIMTQRVLDHGVREINTKTGTAPINWVHMEFTFRLAGSTETITISTVGEGMDYGDKGCYKAQTGATKYALLKAFQIPTGDDPENDSAADTVEPAPRQSAPPPARQQSSEKPSGEKPTIRNPDEPCTEPQQKRLFAISRAGGLDMELLADYIHTTYGVERTKELSKGQISQLMDNVESGKVAADIAKEAFGAEEVADGDPDGLPF